MHVGKLVIHCYQNYQLEQIQPLVPLVNDVQKYINKWIRLLAESKPKLYPVW